MTTLAQILSKKSEIINLVKQFRFSDQVKIHYDLPEEGEEKIKLRLIIKEVSGRSVPHDNEAFLEAKLSAVLNCDVDVTTDVYIPDLNQYDVSRKSALITDEKSIKEIIYRINNSVSTEALVDNDALNSISFEDIELKALDKTDKLFLGLLKQADEYLKTNVEQLSASVSSKGYIRNSVLPLEKKQKHDKNGDSSDYSKENDKKKLRAASESESREIPSGTPSLRKST